MKIGIVGAGAICSLHKEAILKNPDCELAAICDLNPEKARKEAEGTSASIYTDYRKMQEEETLDAVILNLPHFLHRDVTVYFLDRKVAVLVEKPMAITVEECDAMIEASKRNHTPLAVGHVQKYHACYKKLKELMEAGELGQLAHITETINCDYFTNRPAWFLDKKKAGGGIIYNYAPHTLDKIRYLTGLEVEEVMATGNNFLNSENVEASAQMYLKFRGGVGAACTYSAGKVPSQYDTYFYFTDGAAWIEEGYYLHISRKGQPYEKVELDYSYTLFEEQIAEFVKLCRGEASRVVTPEYAREIIKVVQKAVTWF